MGFQRNEIRVVLFDVGGVLVELSGLAMLSRGSGIASPLSRSACSGLPHPQLDHSRLERCNPQLLLRG
jgi:hypothetical protein